MEVRGKSNKSNNVSSETKAESSLRSTTKDHLWPWIIIITSFANSRVSFHFCCCYCLQTDIEDHITTIGKIMPWNNIISHEKEPHRPICIIILCLYIVKYRYYHQFVVQENGIPEVKWHFQNYLASLCNFHSGMFAQTCNLFSESLVEIFVHLKIHKIHTKHLLCALLATGSSLGRVMISYS